MPEGRSAAVCSHHILAGHFSQCRSRAYHRHADIDVGWPGSIGLMPHLSLHGGHSDWPLNVNRDAYQSEVSKHGHHGISEIDAASFAVNVEAIRGKPIAKLYLGRENDGDAEMKTPARHKYSRK